MPNCRSCGAPIFFLSERPEWIAVGNYGDKKPILTEPRQLPIDVIPDNVKGTLAIYEHPSPHSVYPPHRDAKVRKSYVRRLSGYAAESYVRLGGALYRIHFDTCPVRRG